MKSIFACLAVVVTLAFVSSCKDETETLIVSGVADYAPLAKGKYIIYNLDSLVFTNFGANIAHHLYEVKYEVLDTATDNSGRQGFVLGRSIKPANSTANFVYEGTCWASNSNHQFIFVENNLKFLKLAEPIENNFSWKGNSYINTTTLYTDYQYLDGWDYTYDSVGQARTVNNINFPNSVTVHQHDFEVGIPITAQTVFAAKDFGNEIYAKGIGMVYKQFTHWVYQGSSRSYTGYGATYTVKSYN